MEYGTRLSSAFSLLLATFCVLPAYYACSSRMPFFSRTRALSREALDVLFPITCVGCGTYGESGRNADNGEQWLCVACRERIEPDRARCLVCGERSPTGRTCYACLPKTPLVGTIAVGVYRDPVLRSAITALKFRGARALAEPLGELLARQIMAAGLLNVSLPQLIPLPLHPRRERMRGFNQARLLAAIASTQLGIPVRDSLVRTRATAAQTSLRGGSTIRRENVADAFALRSTAEVIPPRVILVDDVLTSGATLEAAARVLGGAGAKEIWAAVIARG